MPLSRISSDYSKIATVFRTLNLEDWEGNKGLSNTPICKAFHIHADGKKKLLGKL